MMILCDESGRVAWTMECRVGCMQLQAMMENASVMEEVFAGLSDVVWAGVIHEASQR
jgi:hypothetical protein